MVTSKAYDYGVFYEALPSHDNLGNHASDLPMARTRRKRALVLAIALVTTIVTYYGIVRSLDTYPNPQSHRKEELRKIPVPRAKQLPETQYFHDIPITDEYSWLRYIDTDPDVSAYIKAENNYTDVVLNRLEPLQDQISKEINQWAAATSVKFSDHGSCSGKRTDSSNFFRYGSYIYWSSYPHGARYPVYYRGRQDAASESSCACATAYSSVETVLDYNKIVPAGASSFSEGVFEPHSREENLIAFSYDTTGSENFHLSVVDLENGGAIKGNLKNTYYSARWGTQKEDVDCIYYNVVDLIWGIPRRIYRYCIDDAKEELVYLEQDVSLTTEVHSTSDAQHLFVKVVGQVTSELRTLARSKIGEHFETKPLFGRVTGIHYHIESNGGYFYILTNAGDAPNFQIVRVNATLALAADMTIEEAVRGGPSSGLDLEVVLEHEEKVFYEKMEVFSAYIAVWVRTGGSRLWKIVQGEGQEMRKLWATDYHPPLGMPTQSGPPVPVPLPGTLFPSTLFDMDARLHRRFDDKCFTYTFSSFLSPPETLVLDTVATEFTSLAETQVAGLNEDAYIQERVWAQSKSDPNIQVPISLVYNRFAIHSRVRPAVARTNPLLLRAYGAYGSLIDPTFDTSILPLLDRGIVFAICHPRGDANLGAAWYTDGKYEKKQHTFDDVATCLSGLVEQGWTAQGRVALFGRSAGGLITGHAVNELGWTAGADRANQKENAIVKLVVTQVPFVDPIGDMTDETVPWTSFEFFEWGNPITNKTIFDAMLAYSPYGNILQKKNTPQVRQYPELFITAGLQDSRVRFWEPVKWIARLRRVYEEDRQHRLLIKVRENGHFGDSGTRETAEWMAVVVDSLIGS
ncbi:prolyl oligopeptidase [Fimicolochytrium jonesii]|uniref:prolyl oligopeptidase n=1 Tax=Fimicolochytrium jonesii TaxID=1396493 RepID=UPI0022FECCB8|nr:prolyl oligopeptidase [Fimicolochytrium jonesii]KAI8821071.1 prolyl oligopeptidase [Fimicolochytrium jonesii]